MKPPSSVVIGPFRYAVRYDKAALDAGNAAGACLRDTETILVDMAQSAGQLRDTVLHECLHAVWAQTGLLKEMDDRADDSDGEKAINVLATAVLDLLRRNPRLVAYLTAP